MQRYILIYGFSMFSMFFGSGNLVFPLQIGLQTGSHWFLGFLGLVFTGIILPFLGLFVIKLHKGDYRSFFSEAGVLAKIFLPFITLSLLSSLGVVPRCIIVAYGGLKHVLPELTLQVFSLIFCILTFISCLNDRFMVDILGKWLTPILLIPLIILIVLGIYNAPEPQNLDLSLIKSFQNGFLQGYQTMDLFAAFFFSALIFKQILINFGSVLQDHKSIIRFATKSSIIGATLLAIIYLGFVYLGAHYRHLQNDVTPDAFLSLITKHLLGNKASIIISVIIFLSCFTTAIALSNIYARYVCTELKITDKKYPIVLLITMSLSFVMSLLDFKGISSFLSPLLTIFYPSLIALTFLSIMFKNYKILKKIVFYIVMFISILSQAR